jgi:hypothetical protein
MITTKYYTKKIKDFLKITETYCKGQKIENTFHNFLFHDMNGICSPAFYFIHLCPKIYLVNSKSFIKYYNSLDKDFQEDIITREQIHENLVFLKKNKTLLVMLKKIQKDDSIL